MSFRFHRHLPKFIYFCGFENRKFHLKNMTIRKLFLALTGFFAFALCTMANDLDSTQYVLAVEYEGKWYAMRQSISSGGARATEIEVVDNSYTTANDDNLIWILGIYNNLYKENERHLKAQSGKYLCYYEKDGTNLSFSTGSDTQWTFEKQADGSYTLTPDADANRRLAFSSNSGNPIFKCYTDGYDYYIYNFRLLPVCQQDSETKALTLKATWNAERLSQLDLSNATSVDLRQIEIPANVQWKEGKNPNCLVYVAPNAANTESIPNLIQVDENGNAAAPHEIILQDGHDFCNKLPFTGSIRYTRHLYEGWSTLALPFPYLLQGENMEEFSSADDDAVTFTTTAATTLEANKAYLIYMDAETDKVFAAENANVPATFIDKSTPFMANFVTFTMANDDHLYKLNNDGTAFNHSDGTAPVSAFRAYLDLNGYTEASNPKRIVHRKENPTGIHAKDGGFPAITYREGTLCITADAPQMLHIYTMDGKMVQSVRLHAGTNHIRIPLKGMYLLNNRKFIF